MQNDSKLIEMLIRLYSFYFFIICTMERSEFGEPNIKKVYKNNKDFIDMIFQDKQWKSKTLKELDINNCKNLLCYIINELQENELNKFVDNWSKLISKLLVKAYRKFKCDYKIFRWNRELWAELNSAKYIILWTFPWRATISVGKALWNNWCLYYCDTRNKIWKLLLQIFQESQEEYKKIPDLIKQVCNKLSKNNGKQRKKKDSLIIKDNEEILNLKNLYLKQEDFLKKYDICLSDRVEICLWNNNSSLDKDRVPLVFKDFSWAKNNSVIILNWDVEKSLSWDIKWLFIKNSNFDVVLDKYESIKLNSENKVDKLINSIDIYKLKCESYEEWFRWEIEDFHLSIYKIGNNKFKQEQFKWIVTIWKGKQQKKILVAARSSTSWWNNGENKILYDNRLSVFNIGRKE